MEITNAHRLPSSYGYSGSSRMGFSGGGDQTQEVRNRIQQQMERIQEVHKQVQSNITAGNVGILGAEQAALALSSASAQISSDPETAQAVQSRGVNSIGTFGVSFA